MNLKKLILKNNACYIAGKTIRPSGIMVHSTGANNPSLKRYVGPNDGLLGENTYNNHWNQNKPDGREVCVHAFIGKLNDGTIATYQTLPWNCRGWHCGGSGNNNYIGFEICEDNLSNKTYFNQVYQEAVELTAYLCKIYDLNPNGKDVIICHQDGYKMGIASNHSDIYHWFNIYKKTMNDFRSDVNKLINNESNIPEKPEENHSFKVGDIVSIKTGSKYYNGSDIPDWVEKDKWIISQVNGDRAVIDKNVKGNNSICSPINTKYLVKESTNTDVPSFKPFTVKVEIDDLNIRKGPGVNYDKTGKVTGKGVFTIVDTKKSNDNGEWGLLKSYSDDRNGWINLYFSKKV